MDIKEFEALLVDEKQVLEKTLPSVGNKNPKNPSDWEPSYPDLGITTADKGDLADEVEEFDNNIGIEAVLEEKLREIDGALERIRSGTYGKCEVGGEEIDEARLRANPASRACIKHSSEN